MIRNVVVGRLRAIHIPEQAAADTEQLDEEHNRLRHELFGPVCAEIARVQIEIRNEADHTPAAGH